MENLTDKMKMIKHLDQNALDKLVEECDAIAASEGAHSEDFENGVSYGYIKGFQEAAKLYRHEPILEGSVDGWLFD